MAYAKTVWANGDVITKDKLDNLEVGVNDLSVAMQIMQFQQLQSGYNTEDELHTVTLSMLNLPWPFNNTPTTVALDGLRESTNYSVECNVLSYSGGRLGNIRVADRACNGFKLIHDGSATTVRVAVRVSGGMIDPMSDE